MLTTDHLLAALCRRLQTFRNWGDCGMSANYGTEPQEDDPLSASLKEEAERLEAERVSNGDQQ